MDYPDHTPYGICTCDACEKNQLRQRVAELEKERDEFEGNAAQWEQEYYKVSKERDKATQYWRIAEGRCDALIKKRDDLLSALENCRLLAARHSKEEWATHILRFCAESGVIGSPIRDNVIASVKEKA